MLPIIEQDTEGAMRDMAELVNDYVNMGYNPPKYGFMILVFPFSDETRKTANYISNCSREDMIKALREKADILEQRKDISTKIFIDQ